MPDLSTEFWIGAGIAIIALVVGIGVTLAMDAKTKGEFRFAVGCFLVSAGGVAYLTGMWQVKTMWQASSRVLIAYALFALVAILTGEGIRWAHARHLRASVSSASPGNSSGPSGSPPVLPAPEPKPASPSKAPILKPPPKSLTPPATTTRLGVGPDAYKEISDEQLGQWAMEEADKIEQMADQTLNRPAATPDILRINFKMFTQQIDECCTQDLIDLRTELLRRLGPPAKDPDEVLKWTGLSLDVRFEGGRRRQINPMLVKSYAPHLRRLGLKVKHRTTSRSAPTALHFSQKLEDHSARLPAGGVMNASEFSGERNQQFPFNTTVTITTKMPFSRGYIVVEFDNRYAGASCDFVNSSVLITQMTSVENKTLVEYLDAHQFTTYALAIGKTAFSPDKPIHVEAFGTSPLHVLGVTHFDE